MRRSLLLLAVAALLGGLLPLTASPALAQSSCPAPGGAGFPAHENVPAGEVQVLGRGWGHGVGMSQYGARGGANLGCSAAQILAAYYPGTQLTAQPDRPIAVSLFPTRRESSGQPGPGVDFLDVYAETDAIPWQVSEGGTGTPTTLTTTQRRGETWRAVVIDDPVEGRQLVVANQSRDGVIIHRGGSSDALILSLENRHLIQLPQKPTSGWNDGRPYRRGDLRIQPTGSNPRLLSATLTLPTVEQYLYGLAEMPSSWHPQALQVQAIAGRSYALRNNRVLLDTPADQVYAGLAKEVEGGASGVGRRWVEAVDASAGRVLMFEGGIAQTFYSSSHGGQSESNRFSAFFSADVNLPYLQPLDDTRWEAAASSPVATWSHAYSREAAGAALGVGPIRSIRHLEQRGAGGRNGVPGRAVYSNPLARYGGMEVVGATGTRVMSGLAFVQALNVTRRSELFEVRVAGPPPPPAEVCEPTVDQAGNSVVVRSSGPGRTETAAAAAFDHWDTATDVVLATAGGTVDGYADALSGAALATSLDAPLLLTGSSTLAPAARDELARLAPQRVHLLGGTAAISAAVEREISAKGHQVIRVSGPDRFATARAAASAAGASPSGDVALALGTDWPDAVSAGTLAGSTDRVPTLLTAAATVPDVTMAGLRELGARRVLLIGGTGVIRTSVETQLRAAGYSVTRLAGDSRFATSVAVARDAVARDDGRVRPAILVSGATFPDALAAGALTARIGAPVLLVPRCTLDAVPGTVSFLASGPFDGGVIVGGLGAVSDRVREQAAEAITR